MVEKLEILSQYRVGFIRDWLNKSQYNWFGPTKYWDSNINARAKTFDNEVLAHCYQLSRAFPDGVPIPAYIHFGYTLGSCSKTVFHKIRSIKRSLPRGGASTIEWNSGCNRNINRFSS